MQWKNESFLSKAKSLPQGADSRRWKVNDRFLRWIDSPEHEICDQSQMMDMFLLPIETNASRTKNGMLY